MTNWFLEFKVFQLTQRGASIMPDGLFVLIECFDLIWIIYNCINTFVSKLCRRQDSKGQCQNLWKYLQIRFRKMFRLINRCIDGFPVFRRNRSHLDASERHLWWYIDLWQRKNNWISVQVSPISLRWTKIQHLSEYRLKSQETEWFLSGNCQGWTNHSSVGPSGQFLNLYCVLEQNNNS